MIHVIAHTQAQPGKGRDIVSLSTVLIAETRKEKGCISYDLYQKPGAPDTLVFVETWESREALEAHFHAPHIRAFSAATSGLKAESRVEIIHPERIEIL